VKMPKGNCHPYSNLHQVPYSRAGVGAASKLL
jgi:hypothetical protein